MLQSQARHGLVRQCTLMLLVLICCQWSMVTPLASAQQGPPPAPRRHTNPNGQQSEIASTQASQAPSKFNKGQSPHEPVVDVLPALQARREGHKLPQLQPYTIQREHGILPNKLDLSAKPIADTGRPIPLSPEQTQLQATPQPEQALAAPQSGITPAAACTPLLTNPDITLNMGGWVITDQLVSASSNINDAGYVYMIDGAETGVDQTPKSDGFGQLFNVPSDTGGFEVDLQIGYNALGTHGAHDHVFINLYHYNGGSSLGTLVYYQELTINPNGTYNNLSLAINDPLVISALINGQAYFTIDTVTDNMAPLTTVFTTYAQISACPANTITGQWKAPFDNPSKDMSNADAVLVYGTSNNNLYVADLASPSTDGHFVFNNVAALVGNGDFYQVLYLNLELDSSRLGFWVDQEITALAPGDPSFSIGATDLTDTYPIQPAHGSKATLNETTVVPFDWKKFIDDTYIFCIYDIEDVSKEICSTPIPADLNNPSTLGLDFILSDPSFHFQYNKTYAWYIWVTPDFTAVENYGLSYDTNYVTFIEQPFVVPATPSRSSPELPTGSTKDWTLMVYMAGDNELGDPNNAFDPRSKLQSHFAELKKLATSYPNVNIVTLTDFFDKNGTQYCYIKSSGAPDCRNLGERDTTDPNELRDFISESLTRFPATHTMLVISDHGNTIFGVGVDDTNHPPSQTVDSVVTITPAKLRAALSGAGLGGSKKLDILFYNACLMGSIETANDSAAYATYLVAGSDTVWMLSPYSKLLPLLKSPTTKNDPRAIAAGIVTGYRDLVNSNLNHVYVSMAAYDLSKAAAVTSAVNSLGQQLRSGFRGTYIPEIQAIRGKVQVYDSSGNFVLNPTNDAFVDLRHLTTLIANDPKLSSAVRNAANTVKTTLGPVGTGLVVATVQQTGNNGDTGTLNLANATGLSLFFPSGSANGGQKTMRALYYGENGNPGVFPSFDISAGGWGAFLSDYTNTTKRNGAEDPIGSNQGTARGGGRTARGGIPQARLFMRYTAYLPIIRK